MKNLLLLLLIFLPTFATAQTMKAHQPACKTSGYTFEMVKAHREGDDDAMVHLIMSGKCDVTDGGESVSIVQNKMAGPIKVRIYYSDGTAAYRWIYPFSMNS